MRGILFKLVMLVLVEMTAIVAIAVLLVRHDMPGALLALVVGMVLGAIIGPDDDERAALSDLCEQQKNG